MGEDYPAAHSMDTDWFSMDARGQVALMRSGEEGAVPHVWEGGQSGGRELEILWRAPVPFDPGGLSGEGLLREADEGFVPLEERYTYDCEHVLLRLAHPRFVERVPGGHLLQGLYAWGRNTPTEALRLLIQHGQVTNAWVFSDFPLLRFGIYTYRARYLGSLSGPYERHAVPSRPLPLDALPPALQRLAVPLPVSFAQHPLVQPLEHLPCRAYGDSYLDSQGRIRDLP